MQTLDVRGLPVDVHIAGSGPALIYLHAEQFVDHTGAFLDGLAKTFRVIAPRFPGFDSRPIPSDIRSAGDLAYLVLDLLEHLDLTGVTMVGASLGGWVALETCIRDRARISRLALVSPVGVKFGGREDRDLTDLFYLSEAKAKNALFADPGRWAPDYAAMAVSEVELLARERESMAYYGWKPYMHNPGLRRWLHRVALPTLVIAGEQDGYAPPAYARQLAAAIPGGQLRLLAGAAHYPQIEQAASVAEAIAAFADGRA